ncbi:MAG: TRAP transporter small permease [Oceanospirillales bacterium]|nr:TRAP transporter small permease [Oceanospirillales bacterium]
MFYNGIERCAALAAKATLILSGCFIALMALHITLDVVLRFVFSTSFQGTLEIVSFYYMVCAIFLSLAYVEYKREHICVDVVVDILPEALKLPLYVFACVLGIVFFSMLGYQSTLDALRATQSQETAMANFTFYIWPSRWALPIGFFATSLATFANMVQAIATRKAL